MYQISEGQQPSTAEVWIKNEPIDDTYFLIKSEDQLSIQPSAVSNDTEVEMEDVTIKSEVSFDTFECVPSTDTIDPMHFTKNDCKMIKTPGTFSLYRCDECGKNFKKKSSFDRHKLSHSGERPFACDECGMRFAQKCHIRPHKLTHSGEKPFSCTECEMRFTQKSTLTTHSKKMHSRGSKIKEEKVIPSSSESMGRQFKVEGSERRKASDIQVHQLHICFECGKRFDRKSKLVIHKRAHSGERPFACDECGMRFGYKHHVKTHKLIHSGERPYACDECGMRFYQKSRVKTHKLTHKSINEISDDSCFCCNECGKKFKRNSQLRSHQRVHTGEKRFVCDLCGKRFAHKVNLNSHLLLHHSDRRPFACDDCDKSFAERRHLITHKQTHTDPNLRPYRCDECGAKFLRKWNFENHQRSHKLKRAKIGFEKEEEQASMPHTSAELVSVEINQPTEAYTDYNSVNNGESQPTEAGIIKEEQASRSPMGAEINPPTETYTD